MVFYRLLGFFERSTRQNLKRRWWFLLFLTSAMSETIEVEGQQCSKTRVLDMETVDTNPETTCQFRDSLKMDVDDAEGFTPTSTDPQASDSSDMHAVKDEIIEKTATYNVDDTKPQNYDFGTLSDNKIFDNDVQAKNAEVRLQTLDVNEDPDSKTSECPQLSPEPAVDKPISAIDDFGIGKPENEGDLEVHKMDDVNIKHNSFKTAEDQQLQEQQKLETDVEIVKVETAKVSNEERDVVTLTDDEEESDEELMGFHFNTEGVLVDKNNEQFKFNRYGSDAENQRRYQKLGEKITEYVYGLLETRCKLKRFYIPLDAEDGEDQSFIFLSENSFTTEDKLVVFIHGNGVVRAGQWARSLIINHNLKAGTQIPFIEEAMKSGYEVMVLNTNLNSLSKSRWQKDYQPIRGSEDPEKHAIYIWENLVMKKVKAKHIAIIAHSYGGIVTKELLRHYSKDFSNRVFAIAFTDSVHSMDLVTDSDDVTEFFREHARNWVTSSLPLDEHITDETLEEINDAPRYSAGHEKHEWTSWSSFEAIFRFLKEKYSRAGLLTSNL